MPRLVAVLAVLAVLHASGHAALFEAGSSPNKLSVTFSYFPDPFHWFSFFPMPRTVAAAQAAKFAQVTARAEDQTTVWCYKNEYRVCLLFDAQGSVAGIQMSVAVKDVKDVPLEFEKIPEWHRQTLLGEDVFSATAFFVGKDVLLGGGRALNDDTATAPNGLYILQKDGDRLFVAADEAAAPEAGFNEEACFGGMGKHYFQDMSKATKCEMARPFFLLFGPQSKKMVGFGFSAFGKPSQSRGWFEAPSSSVAKSIVPQSPDCLTDWIDRYGLTTFHVYFVDNAYHIRC